MVVQNSSITCQVNCLKYAKTSVAFSMKGNQPFSFYQKVAVSAMQAQGCDEK